CSRFARIALLLRRLLPVRRPRKQQVQLPQPLPIPPATGQTPALHHQVEQERAEMEVRMVPVRRAARSGRRCRAGLLVTPTDPKYHDQQNEGDLLETTMRTLASLLVFLLAFPLRADEPKVQRGLAYAEPKNERQTLDVYAPAEGKDLPVVLWIHGGGWRAGDKANVQKKPQAFADKGYVFVSTNYRFVPQVTVKEMAGDIAKAIRWVHDHARDYGGDPKAIFVMGHSAGAHLAALVCTDDRYLKAE